MGSGPGYRRDWPFGFDLKLALIVVGCLATMHLQRMLGRRRGHLGLVGTVSDRPTQFVMNIAAAAWIGAIVVPRSMPTWICPYSPPCRYDPAPFWILPLSNVTLSSRP